METTVKQLVFKLKETTTYKATLINRYDCEVDRVANDLETLKRRVDYLLSRDAKLVKIEEITIHEVEL